MDDVEEVDEAEGERPWEAAAGMGGGGAKPGDERG